MEIREFLEQSVGSWFCQRTSYIINPEKSDSSKAENVVTFLDLENPQLVELCSEYNLDSNLSIGGLKSEWDNSVDWGKPQEKGTAVIVVFPDPQQPYQGKIVQTSNSDQWKSLQGKYIIGNDQALTLKVELPKMTITERIWFASDNLRLRASIIESSQGWTKTSFYSEIRKVTSAS